MKEYYKQPDATAGFFWRDDNGMEWGCTGDVGYVDEDVILKHSAVDQCEVVGVEGSDGYDLLYAYIVKKKETTKNDEQIILELQALCEEKMESGFIPKQFVVLTKFPVKASGKRDMEQLKEMAKKYNI